MNPASSFASTVVLPRRSPNARAKETVSALVMSDGVISIRSITGGGLKKCRPTTLSGREVADASVAIGIDEVFDANTASGPTTRSSSRKIASFASRSSVAASMTSSTSPSDATSVVPRIRPTSASRSSGSSLPRSTARPVEASSRSRPRASRSSVGSSTVTSIPTRATTWAIPEPIRPKPTTPTRFTSCARTTRSPHTEST